MSSMLVVVPDLEMDSIIVLRSEIFEDFLKGSCKGGRGYENLEDRRLEVSKILPLESNMAPNSAFSATNHDGEYSKVMGFLENDHATPRLRSHSK